MFSGTDIDCGSSSPSHIRVDVPFSRGKTASDLYLPRHRLYPIKGSISSATPWDIREDDPVIHKDIITVWKGLSIAQAHELIFWDQTMQACMENLIGESLVYEFSRFNNTDGLSAPQVLRPLCDFVNSFKIKTFSADIAQLISRMLDRYAQYGKQHTWLLSSGNLQLALANLIRIKDCFVDASPYCSFRVHLSASVCKDISINGLRISGEIEWTPPYLAFENLETTVLNGSQCHVQPRFTEPLLHQGYPQYPFVYEHRIGCEDLKVDWDDGLQGFRCKTPQMVKVWSRIKAWNTPDGCGYLTPVDVQTVAAKHFPDNVKFERTFRVRIELAVFQGLVPRDLGSSVQWRRPAYPSGIRDMSNRTCSTVLPRPSNSWGYDLRVDRRPSSDIFGVPSGLNPSTAQGSRTISWYSSIGPVENPVRGRYNASDCKLADASASSGMSSIGVSSAFQSIAMTDSLGYSHGAKREASASFERPGHLKRPELSAHDINRPHHRDLFERPGHVKKHTTDEPLSVRRQRMRHPVSQTKDESEVGVDLNAKGDVEYEPKQKRVYGPVADLTDEYSRGEPRVPRVATPPPFLEIWDSQYYADQDDESVGVTPAVTDGVCKLSTAAQLEGLFDEPADKRHDSVWSPPLKPVEILPSPVYGTQTTSTSLLDASRADETHRLDEFLHALPCMLASAQLTTLSKDISSEASSEFSSEVFQETPRPVYHPSKQFEELLDQRKIQGNYETFLEAKQEKELERLKMRLAAQRGGSVVNAPHDSDQEAFEADFLEDVQSSEVSTFESERWDSGVNTPSVVLD